MSKLDYIDVVRYPLPEYLERKLQRIQNVAAGFVLHRYTTESDFLEKLRYLSIKERA